MASALPPPLGPAGAGAAGLGAGAAAAATFPLDAALDSSSDDESPPSNKSSIPLMIDVPIGLLYNDKAMPQKRVVWISSLWRFRCFFMRDGR
jgi:hypothetical protein